MSTEKGTATSRAYQDYRRKGQVHASDPCRSARRPLRKGCDSDGDTLNEGCVDNVGALYFLL